MMHLSSSKWMLLMSTAASVAMISVAAEQPPKPPVLPAKEDLLVQGLEDIVPAFGEYAGEMYAGRLPVDNDYYGKEQRKGELMFWLFVPHEPASKNTLTVWLNGGPGCSSFYAGIFFEHGPVTIPLHTSGFCCVSEDAPLVHNPYSWAYATHMLYVEQPVGVGFSQGDGPKPQNELEIAADMYAFLENFYRVFPEYNTNYELHITGESYAGMYVPSIAIKVYQEEMNKKMTKTKKKSKRYGSSSSDDVNIHLGGIAIGNGVLDARIQGPTRIDYAYYHGQIDLYTRGVLHTAWEACMDKHTKVKEPFHSFNPPDDCGMLTAIPLAAGKGASSQVPAGPNIYDVTTWDPYAILKGDNTITRFYNNPQVQEKLHAPDMVWNGCMPGAGRRRRRLETEEDKQDEQFHEVEYDSNRNLLASFLLDDKPVSMAPYIGELLDGGVRALFYAGDRDMSCNAAGVEAVLNGVEWHGSKHWYKAPRALWLSNETDQLEPAGYAKQYQNLNFVVVYNSGHLVPYNKPANGLDLLTRFLRNETLGQYPIDISSLENAISTYSSERMENEVPEPDHSSFRKETWALLLAFALGFGASYFCWQFQLIGKCRRKSSGGGYESIPSAP